MGGNTFRTMATTRQQAAARRKSKVQAELYMQHKADAIYNSGTETNWDFEPEEELARASSAMGYSENVPFVQVEEPPQTKSLVLQRSKSYEEPRSKSMVYQPHSNTLNQSPVRAQEETAVRDLFRKSDVNGDGLLSVEELQYGLSDWGFPDEVVEQLFFEVDKDGDERINMDEWMQSRILRKLEIRNLAGLCE